MSKWKVLVSIFLRVCHFFSVKEGLLTLKLYKISIQTHVRPSESPFWERDAENYILHSCLSGSDGWVYSPHCGHRWRWNWTSPWHTEDSSPDAFPPVFESDWKLQLIKPINNIYIDKKPRAMSRFTHRNLYKSSQSCWQRWFGPSTGALRSPAACHPWSEPSGRRWPVCSSLCLPCRPSGRAHWGPPRARATRSSSVSAKNWIRAPHNHYCWDGFSFHASFSLSTGFGFKQHTRSGALTD